MSPGEKLALRLLWLLLLLAVAVALNYMRWMRTARRLETARDAPPKPLTDARTLFYIVVIISACLATFLYFRANFPH